MSAHESCAVCGRTILAGERPRGYLTPGGERHLVCELCRDRAERLGWVWEETAGEVQVEPEGQRRGGPRGIFAAWRKRMAVASPRLDPPADPLGEPEPEFTEPPAEEPNPDPAARGAHVGRVEPEIPETPKGRLERATERFNASEAARTVGGLMRTLGEPWVSIGAIAGSPNEVRITVAWELSWYQWAVDLRDELRPVSSLDKGHEIEQLDSSARQWNATAMPGGQLLLGAPVRRPDHQPIG